tara:strand:+ start:210 stop:2015 length:1806 start_codon:yes stop_codon:yes gene_type:complete
MAETQTIILDLQTTGAEQVEKNLDKVAEAAAAANENVEKLGESTNKSLEKGKKSTDDLSKSLQGAESAASGFSGALAVLGLEDTWLDNLSSGVGNLLQFKGGITEGVKGAQSLAKATKGASVAQRIFNAAMNANPIFLLVTVIAAVTAGVIALSAALSDSRTAQEKVNDTLAEGEKAYADQINELEVYKRELAATNELTLALSASIERQQQILRNTGAIEAAAEEMGNLLEEQEEYNKAIAGAEKRLRILRGSYKDTSVPVQQAARDLERLKREQAAVNEELTTFQDAASKLNRQNDLLQALEDINEEYDKFNQNQLSERETIVQETQTRIDQLKKGLDEGLISFEAYNIAYTKLADQRRKRLKEIDDKEAADRRAKRQAEEQARIDELRRMSEGTEFMQRLSVETIQTNQEETESLQTLAGGYQELTVQTEDTATARIESLKGLGYELLENREAIGDAISGVGALFGEESKQAFEIQKGVSIAQTTISTIEGAIAAYKSLAGIPYVGPALGAAAAAGVTASGLAAVQQIRSQTYQGGGSGGGGSLNLPSGGGGPEQGFLVPSTPTAADTPQAEPVQAYVIGQQITNQQALDSELKLRSTL